MINGCQANGEWCKVRLDHLEPSVTRSARWLTPVSWEWAPAGPNGLTVINGPIYMAQQQQTWISEYQAARWHIMYSQRTPEQPHSHCDEHTWLPPALKSTSYDK